MSRAGENGERQQSQEDQDNPGLELSSQSGYTEPSGVGMMQPRNDSGTRVPCGADGPSGCPAIEAVVLTEWQGNDEQDQPEEEQPQVVQAERLTNGKIGGQADQERRAGLATSR